MNARDGKPAWRTRLRRTLWATGALVLLALAIAGFTHLKNEHLGPFALATGRKAFLNTTYGMSPQEVRRAMGLSSTRWCTGNEAEFVERRGMEPEVARRMCEFTAYDTVFGAPASIDFGFFADRLMEVRIEIRSPSAQTLERVVAKASESLQQTYGQPVRRVEEYWRWLLYSSPPRSASIGLMEPSPESDIDGVVRMTLRDSTFVEAFMSSPESRDPSPF